MQKKSWAGGGSPRSLAGPRARASATSAGGARVRFGLAVPAGVPPPPRSGRIARVLPPSRNAPPAPVSAAAGAGMHRPRTSAAMLQPTGGGMRRGRILLERGDLTSREGRRKEG